MDLALITLQQVFILFILIFIGIICRKLNIIKPEGKQWFSNLLLYIIVPCMVVDSYMQDLNPEILPNLLKTIILSAIVLTLSVIIAFLITFKYPSKDRRVMQFAIGFSNCAYMGFPLITAMFGAEGLLYASVFVTMFNLYLWTVGIGIMSREVSGKAIAMSILKTPVLYAVIIGLFFYLTQIKLPIVITQPLGQVGDMNTPLSMIITGMLIADSDIIRILKNKDIYFTILFRMLIIPTICFVIVKLTGITGIVANVCIILISCPTAAITSAFSVNYGHNEEYASGAVVMTTLISIVTLPIIAYLLTIL